MTDQNKNVRFTKIPKMNGTFLRNEVKPPAIHVQKVHEVRAQEYPVTKIAPMLCKTTTQTVVVTFVLLLFGYGLGFGTAYLVYE